MTVNGTRPTVDTGVVTRQPPPPVGAPPLPAGRPWLGEAMRADVAGEWRGSRIDLLVGRDQPTTLIELKYPREPNPANAAWTIALSEVLKDSCRLAGHQARWTIRAMITGGPATAP